MREMISNIPKDFTIAVEDESIFVHDALARRRMWIPKGSHQKTCVFGVFIHRWKTIIQAI